MIKLLTDLPAGVVGMEAVGHVEADDYTNVVEPAVRAALQHSDKVRLLYVLGEGFEGYSAAASWEDAKLGIGHWSAWERIAIVTDRGWIRDALKAFRLDVPRARSRSFPSPNSRRRSPGSARSATRSARGERLRLRLRPPCDAGPG